MPARRRNPGFDLGAMATAAAVAAVVVSAAKQYGLDPALLLAMAQRESGLNPNAVSPAGAQGVMQLMPATARALGVTNPFDVMQNVNAGARYLAQLLRQFGDVTKAVAAYDWGPGSVSNAVAQYADNWLAVAPAETQAYVQALLGVTPAAPPTPTPPAPPAGTYTTIDAATGQVVDDTTATPAPAGALATMGTPGNLVLMALLAAGAWFAADLLRD